MFKFALEIKDYDSYMLACAIWPHLRELKREAIEWHFLAFDAENDGTLALYSPGAVGDSFDHIENGPQIMIKRLIEK